MRIQGSNSAQPVQDAGVPSREYHMLYRRRERLVWCVIHAPGPWSAYLQLRASFPREDVEILTYHEACSC